MSFERREDSSARFCGAGRALAAGRGLGGRILFWWLVFLKNQPASEGGESDEQNEGEFLHGKGRVASKDAESIIQLQQEFDYSRENL